MPDVRRAPRLPALACIAAFASGCVPALAQNPPRDAKKAVPASYGGPPGSATAPPQAADASRQTWRVFFEDPALKALIDRALEENQELNVRLQEMIIARSEIMGRQGEYLPQLDAHVGAGVEKVGEETSQGRSDRAHGVPENLQHYELGFAASWEIDIWRKLRNAAKAATYRYLASVEGKNFMVTQLVAEVASSYYELAALDNQLEVLRRNVDIQRHALAIVKLEKQAARVTQLAVQRFEAEVLKNQGRRYELEQRRVEVENRLNFLLGRFPQPIARNSQNFKDPLPDVVFSGIPARLLDSRPDVRQAALELEAAKLDVKAARAAFYPSLSIEAGVGYEAFNLEHLVTTPESLLYDIAGNLTAPLLNRRAIKARYYSANARQLQAVFEYERTLLSAFTEVVNGLAMIENLQQSYELKAQQVNVLTQSTETSEILFQSARADYVEVLLTRRDSLEAEMELIETRARQRRALVSVYQALGGGWQ